MCIKFNGCEKLQMKTWKKRSFDVYVYLSKDIVNLYFLSSKKMVVYIGIIHESWWKLLDHYYLSLLCLPLGLFLVYNFKSSFFRHFSFSFPTITLRAWSVPELFHWVQFDTWQLRGQVSRTRTEACKALTNSFVGNKKMTVLPPNATEKLKILEHQQFINFVNSHIWFCFLLRKACQTTHRFISVFPYLRVYIISRQIWKSILAMLFVSPVD